MSARPEAARIMLGFVVRQCAVALGHAPTPEELASWANEQRDARGRYEFALRIYTLPGYRRGDERRLLAQLDASLTAEVTAEGPRPSEPAPAAAPPAPR